MKEFENIKYVFDELVSVMILDVNGIIIYINDMYICYLDY